jgi:predicted nucleotidyltransferase
MNHYSIFKETKKKITVDKVEIKNKIVDLLKGQKEIERIIIFGSFYKSESPNDIDIAVVQNSSENYLTLALKYRKLIRNIPKAFGIAVDIFPVLEKNSNSFYSREIASGVVIYARGN